MGGPGNCNEIYRLLVQILLAASCLILITNTNAEERNFLGGRCDSEEFDVRADPSDKTQFLFCDPRTRTVKSESCPIVNGQRKVFDAIRHMCKFPRIRRMSYYGDPGVPRSSRLGEPCVYNTDCLQNLYCLAGSCVCIPGFVDIGEECVPAINPGQSGCVYDRQCAGAWPSTTCKKGVCECPNDQFPVETRDGVVCVKPGKCPVPDGYTGSSSLDQLSNSTTCHPERASIYWYSDGETTPTEEKSGCYDNGHYAGDIYDCIPHAAADKTSGMCCPSRALTCIQPKLGAVDGSESRYWYNSVTGECENFMWNSAGGVGNSNNFRTHDHCMTYCAGVCPRGAAQISKGKSLACLSMDMKCDSSHFSCSASNGKSRYCCPSKDFICSYNGGRLYSGSEPPTGPDLGVGPPETSKGGALGGTRWFYDRKMGRCIAFDYKGLAGNFNNFLNENDCQMFCGKAKCEQGEPLKDYSGNDQYCAGMIACPSAYECRKNVCCPKAQTICLQPKFVSTMSCGATSRQRYWFNAKTRDCEQFNDGGCRGNDNNFDTYASCMAYCSNIRSGVKCVQGEPDRDSSGEHQKCSTNADNCKDNFECYFDGNSHGCCPTKDYICNLPSESGKACSTSTLRWHFDPTLRLCRPFEYMGCDGNGNNFMNRGECEKFCGGGGQTIGCPFGGVGTEDVQSLKNRACDLEGDSSCGNGFECSKVSSNGHHPSYCCPTREHICRLDHKIGESCSASPPSKRYFFNVQKRECEQFSYRGCGGNENSFVTMSQCAKFCLATACKSGETVYMEPGTREALKCRVSQADSACPNGYSCVYSDLLNRGVCCGSTDMGVCPTGDQAYVDPVSHDPKECRSSKSNDDCPQGHVCHQHSSNQFYCCKKSTPEKPETSHSSDPHCPPGHLLHHDFNQQPQTCDRTKKSLKAACPAGFSCYASKYGQSRGFCCSTAIETKKENLALLKLCPRGFIGYKQQGINNIRICSNSTGGKLPCPFGYACIESPVDGRGRCCGISAGCPYPSVAYITSKSGEPMRCRQGGACPNGYVCKPTSSNSHTCCSSSITVEEDELDPDEESHLMPLVRGVKTLKTDRPKCPSDAEEDESVELSKTIQLCDVDRLDSCPVGFECAVATNMDVQICCKSLRNVCNGQSAPYLNPISKRPQACLAGLSSRCPTGFRCAFSEVYEKYFCCSTGDMCPAGHEAYLTPNEMQPRRCVLNKRPCPESHTCMYSVILKDYICCARSNKSNFVDVRDRRNCKKPCLKTGQFRCAAGFSCEEIGQGVERCCPTNQRRTEENEDEEEQTETVQENDDDCNVQYDDPDVEEIEEVSSVALHPVASHCQPRDPKSCPVGRHCRYLGRKRGHRCCPGAAMSIDQETATVTKLGPKLGQCKNGKAYLHPATRTPLVCSFPTGFCPNNFICEYSSAVLRYVCCPKYPKPKPTQMHSPERGATIFVPGGEYGSIYGSLAQIPVDHLAGNFSHNIYSVVNQRVPVQTPFWMPRLSPFYVAPSPNPFLAQSPSIQSPLSPSQPGYPNPNVNPSQIAYPNPNANPIQQQTYPNPDQNPSPNQQQPYQNPYQYPYQQYSQQISYPLQSKTAEPVGMDRSTLAPNVAPGTRQELGNYCDLTQKKNIGQECCHDSQCGTGQPCRWFAGRKICRCPMNLILDMTVFPFRCASSCLMWLHDEVCTLIKQHGT